MRIDYYKYLIRQCKNYMERSKVFDEMVEDDTISVEQFIDMCMWEESVQYPEEVQE